MIKAYKGFHKNLQGYGKFQYKVGKTYELDGELEICKNGFHYCKRIIDIDWYYDLRYSRVCEVEILGSEVADGDGKFATDRIRIVRELSRGEINKYFEDNLDELVKDEDWEVRWAVARMGFGLDILVSDENEDVRKKVAKHGRSDDLAILVNDEYLEIRREVAKHGSPEDLNILVFDESWAVRLEVAKHGRPQYLDILVSDESWAVRLEVARHGRPKDLDILVHDTRVDVRYEVSKHGRLDGLKVLANDEDREVRSEVARNSISKYLNIFRKILKIFNRNEE